MFAPSDLTDPLVAAELRLVEQRRYHEWYYDSSERGKALARGRMPADADWLPVAPTPSWFHRCLLRLWQWLARFERFG